MITASSTGAFVQARSLPGKGYRLIVSSTHTEIRVESLIAMDLFTADLFRNLAIGFGLGALVIALALASQMLLALL
jgi:hypothetical protein